MNYKIYFLDNEDSFSYNLVDEFAQLRQELVVYRNTVAAEVIFERMCAETQPVVLVLSPGPGAPDSAGCLMALIDLCRGRFPMLGICLGQQALTQAYGGEIGHAQQTVHGKSSTISLTPHPAFSGFGEHLVVARYHSLVATKVSEQLAIIAHYQGMPMAVCQPQDKVLGYQFHPESILTPHGAQLLQQSLEYLTAQG